MNDNFVKRMKTKIKNKLEDIINPNQYITDNLDIIFEKQDKEILKELIEQVLDTQNKKIINYSDQLLIDINYEKNILDLFKPKTLFGEILLLNNSKQFTDNKQDILEKQNCIKILLNNPNISFELNNYLQFNSNFHKSILPFWQDNNSISSIKSLVYYNFGNIKFINDLLNKNDLILNLSNNYSIFINPISSFISPIFSILVSYIFLRWTKIKMSFTQFFKLSKSMFISTPSILRTNSNSSKTIKGIMFFGRIIYFAFYIYNIYNLFNLSYIKNISVSKIWNTSNTIVNKIESLFKIIEKNKNIFFNFFTINELQNLDKIFEIFNGLDLSIYGKNKVFDLTINKGKILVNYLLLEERKDILLQICNLIGIIDKNIGIAKCLVEKQYFTRKCSFSNLYVNEKNLVIKNGWLPNLDNCSTNNCLLTKNSILLINGLNGSGKSTYMKMQLFNIFLSQSLGVACADLFVCSPFSSVLGHLSLTDDTGNLSLFQKEVSQCKELIENLEYYKGSNNKTFIVLDELFSSTNPTEGLQSALHVIERINSFNNCLCTITTHYSNIKDEINRKELSNQITYRHFWFDRNKNFDFKLKLGFCKNNIGFAIETVKNSLNI